MLQNLNDLVTPIVEKIGRFNVLDCSLPRAFTDNVSTIYNCSVVYGTSASCITNKKGQHIFLSNNWFYIAAILAPLHGPFYEYKNLLNEIVEKDILKDSNNDRIRQLINSNEALSLQDKEYLIKFATDPLWWNGGNSNTGGKSLDRNDALVSSVLSIANLVNASQSYVATLWEFFGENPRYTALLNSAAEALIENSAAGSGIYGVTSEIQKIYFGTPGSGKSFKVAGIIEGHEDYTFRTTFHPDCDYASFVGSYKPIKDEDEGKLTYTFVPQAFTNAYVKAWQNPEEQIYLVIEEINRGNCAQIFGDLFQLLDRNEAGISEYPIKADTDLKNYLEQTLGVGAQGILKGEVLLPANFHILATMNTSDQSLFPMDSAFKRRWAWEYVPIDSANEKSQFKITIGDKTYRWASFLDKVNERIHKLSDSEDKQMGNFFIKSDVDVEEFKSKVMFYLWSEVCKEYEKSGSFFKYKNSEEKEVEFTFNSLFPTNDVTNKQLQGFMAYLGVEEDFSDVEKAEFDDDTTPDPKYHSLLSNVRSTLPDTLKQSLHLTSGNKYLTLSSNRTGYNYCATYSTRSKTLEVRYELPRIATDDKVAEINAFIAKWPTAIANLQHGPGKTTNTWHRWWVSTPISENEQDNINWIAENLQMFINKFEE